MSVAESRRPAVIFDLGAVLVDWNPRYLYRKIFSDEAEMEHFLTHVCSPDWNIQQDAGRPFAEATRLLAEQHPKYSREIHAFHERWAEMIPGPIQGTVDILEQLHQEGFYLAALSNWSAETFPIARERFDFFDCFAEIVLSGEEHCIKPDSEIYHILLERTGLKASECIFIDDSLPNIEAAITLGFQALHFENPIKLRQQLAASHSALAGLQAWPNAGDTA